MQKQCCLKSNFPNNEALESKYIDFPTFDFPTFSHVQKLIIQSESIDLIGVNRLKSSNFGHKRMIYIYIYRCNRQNLQASRRRYTPCECLIQYIDAGPVNEQNF